MSNPRSDTIDLLDGALQECLPYFVQPDAQEAAGIAVDALLANPVLLAGLVSYAGRLDPVQKRVRHIVGE